MKFSGAKDEFWIPKGSGNSQKKQDQTANIMIKGSEGLWPLTFWDQGQQAYFP